MPFVRIYRGSDPVLQVFAMNSRRPTISALLFPEHHDKAAAAYPLFFPTMKK